MKAILTPDDMRKGDAVEPGWFPAEVTSFNEEVTKGSELKPSDGSMNAIFEFTILDGPPQNKGKVIKRYFNEKALGFGKNLFATFGLIDKSKGGELDTEKFRSLVGQKLQVYMKQDGKWATIEDYRPMPKA